MGDHWAIAAARSVDTSIEEVVETGLLVALTALLPRCLQILEKSFASCAHTYLSCFCVLAVDCVCCTIEIVA